MAAQKHTTQGVAVANRVDHLGWGGSLSQHYLGQQARGTHTIIYITTRINQSPKLPYTHRQRNDSSQSTTKQLRLTTALRSGLQRAAVKLH